ncbi:MAG: hypothetical protein AB1716_03490 [Planctomycetota bacterium]
MNDTAVEVVIVVEDDPNDVELIARVFRKHNLANRLVVLRDGAEALAFLLPEGPAAAGPPPARVVFLGLRRRLLTTVER